MWNADGFLMGPFSAAERKTVLRPRNVRKMNLDCKCGGRLGLTDDLWWRCSKCGHAQNFVDLKVRQLDAPHDSKGRPIRALHRPGDPEPLFRADDVEKIRAVREAARNLYGERLLEVIDAGQEGYTRTVRG